MHTSIAGVISGAYKVSVDFAVDGVFTRSSEASVFDSATGVVTWHGVDVLRYDPTLGALIEGSRQNIMTGPEVFSSWQGSPVITADDLVAPDGDMDADRIGINSSNTLAQSGAPGSHVPGNLCHSGFFIHTANGTQTSFREFSDGGARFTTPVNLTSTWQRVEIRTNTNTGSAIFVGGGNFFDSGNYPNHEMGLWGFQSEEKSRFVSSYIRGNQATRASDSLHVPSTKRWDYNLPYSFDFTPGFATDIVTDFVGSADNPVGYGSNEFSTLFAVSANDYISVEDGTFKMFANGVEILSQVLDFSRWQTMTFTIDRPANEITISGATSGNGTYNPVTWDAWVSGQTVYVGQDHTNAKHAFGYITEPY